MQNYAQASRRKEIDPAILDDHRPLLRSMERRGLIRGGLMRGPISQAALLVGVLLLSAAAPYGTRLDAGTCRAATPALLQRLGADWQDASGYVQDCPVPGPDGKTALSVAVASIDRMQTDHWFNTHHDPHILLPVLLDGESHVLGKPAEGFPADLPGALIVTFKDWRDGMPLRIDQYEAFETALPPHALATQVWVPAKRQYRKLAEEP